MLLHAWFCRCSPSLPPLTQQHTTSWFIVIIKPLSIGIYNNSCTDNFSLTYTIVKIEN